MKIAICLGLIAAIGLSALGGLKSRAAAAADHQDGGGGYDYQSVCDFTNLVEEESLDLLRIAAIPALDSKSAAGRKTALYKRNGRTIKYFDAKDRKIVIETMLEQAAIPEYVASRDQAAKLFGAAGSTSFAATSKFRCDGLKLEIGFKGPAVTTIAVINDLSPGDAPSPH
jgi:hypothetical protein